MNNLEFATAILQSLASLNNSTNFMILAYGNYKIDLYFNSA